MTIDAILTGVHAMPAEGRIARLEEELRHFYYKAHRMEYPHRLVVRGGKVIVVPNEIGLGEHRTCRRRRLTSLPGVQHRWS
jgi:hypothetical protein